MKKIIFLSVFFVALLVVSGRSLLAQPVSPPISLPPQAQKVAPGLYRLGSAIDPVSRQRVEGYAIVKYKTNPGKPSGCNNDGVCQGWESASCADCSAEPQDPVSTCYAFLATGAKWRQVENYLFNPTNNQGIGASYLFTNFDADIQKWESAAQTDIIGTLAGTLVNGADFSSPDGQNEVYFADVSEPNAIAITVIWGVFGGSPKKRQLVEWDQVYDQVDFAWSDSGADGKMDFENIATHELGHSVGLADLYTSECSQETMYGYASNGETIKRDLNSGDITGIRQLYQ